MRIGSTRVSMQDQKLELQLDALKKADREVIFEENASGKDMERNELDKRVRKLRAGDTLVVWKLDWQRRSIKDLIGLMAKLREMKVTFVSLRDGIIKAFIDTALIIKFLYNARTWVMQRIADE